MALDTFVAGELYEPYVGRWSRGVAKPFLQWLAIPARGNWLDVGCGTGALTHCILEFAAPASVLGVDASAGFIEHARAHTNDPRASFEVGSAESLPIEPARFDAAVSGLMLNFVPAPERALAEMRRVVRAGGWVACYVWDYSGQMELMRIFWDAAAELEPAARDLDEGVRFPICRPEPLASLFRGAGLEHVDVKAIDVRTHFRDFEDFWSPFLGGQGPAPSYCMSLDEPTRVVLRTRIHSKLRFERDGSIDLVARAWAVKGRAP